MSTDQVIAPGARERKPRRDDHYDGAAPFPRPDGVPTPRTGVGFHRLITHRSFTARRRLKITLAVAGSMSFQGSVIDWVAIHRRHHAFTDRPGDPHSPYRYGPTLS